MVLQGFLRLSSHPLPSRSSARVGSFKGGGGTAARLILISGREASSGVASRWLQGVSRRIGNLRLPIKDAGISQHGRQSIQAELPATSTNFILKELKTGFAACDTLADQFPFDQMCPRLGHLLEGACKADDRGGHQNRIDKRSSQTTSGKS